MSVDSGRGDEAADPAQVEFPLYVEDVDDTDRYHCSTVYRILADGTVIAITREHHKGSQGSPGFRFQIDSIDAPHDLADFLEMQPVTAAAFYGRLQELRDLLDLTSPPAEGV